MGGVRYPLAIVSREAAQARMLMLPRVLAMRDRFCQAAAADRAQGAP